MRVERGGRGVWRGVGEGSGEGWTCITNLPNEDILLEDVFCNSAYKGRYLQDCDQRS